MRLVMAAVLASVLSAASADSQPSIGKCGVFKANEGGSADRRAVPKSLENQIVSFARDSSLFPGMAIAVIKDGEVVLQRGYGFADLGSCVPVTVETQFYLKSTTKSFLGLLAALLHEEGVVGLDAPVTKYLPGLQLAAPLNADQISLRSHFTHTIPYMDSGLNYVTAAFGNLPEAEFIPHVNRFAAPRSIEFSYSNFGPIIGAHALGAATGANWRDLIEIRIFTVAGMSSSVTHVSKASAAAVSYLSPAKGDFVENYTKDDRQMHAAGGAFSSILDMAKFTQIELGGGAINGEVIFPKRAMEQARARQAQLDWTYFEFRRFAAGLGLYDADYEGDILTHHFGGETHFSFMPERGLGVVILTNAIGDGSLVTHRLAALIYDELLEKKDARERWARRLAEIDSSFDQGRKQIDDYYVEMRRRAPRGPKTIQASELAGVYRNDRLGDVAITADAGALSIQIGAKDGAPEWVSGDAYFVDVGLWGEPPALWVFRSGDKPGEMVIDWGGRIFTRLPA